MQAKSLSTQINKDSLQQTKSLEKKLINEEEEENKKSYTYYIRAFNIISLKKAALFMKHKIIEKELNNMNKNRKWNIYSHSYISTYLYYNIYLLTNLNHTCVRI